MDQLEKFFVLNRNRPQQTLRAGLVVCLIVTVFGCSTSPRVEENLPPPPDVLTESADVPESILPRTDPDVLYFVGAAEILGLRDQFAESAEMYARAAALSDDPAIAERAVRVATYAENTDLIRQGLARWIELDKASLTPHHYASVLALKEGDGEAAWIHVQRLLVAPDNPDAWDAVGKMLSAAPNDSAARLVHQRLLANYQLPDAEPVLQQFADLALRYGDMDGALQLIGRAIELEPDSAESFNWRGRILHSQGDTDGAEIDFAKAVELSPDNAMLRQSYAALLADTKQFERAVEVLEPLPADANVIYTKALYSQAADDHQRAEQYLEQLAALDVEDTSRHAFLLGQLAETLERPTDEILAHYAKVTTGPELDRAKLRRAVVLANDGQLDQARFLLSRLQNGNEDVAALAFMAEAELLRDAGKEADATAVFQRGVSFLPDNAELRYARALHAERMGDIEMAEADLRHVLALNPDDATALNALGYTLADRTDRFDEALELITRAYEKSPDQAAIVDSMGWVHFKLGRLEEAESFLRDALALEFDAEIAAHLGEVLWVKGEESAARATWQEALDRGVNSDKINDTRARLGAE